MPNAKLSGLTELTTRPAADDELLVRDVSDTTMAASGTNKRCRYDVLMGDMLAPILLGEVSITGATTLTASAFGRWHRCSGTSANYTVGLPAVSGNAGQWVGFIMDGALTKLVTLDGNSSETIDGATTRVMWSGETALLLCNGTSWNKIAGTTRPMECVMRRNADQINVNGSTLTAITLNATDADNTGLMADTSNNRILILRSANYLVTGIAPFNDNDGSGGLPANVARCLVYCEKNESGNILRQGEMPGLASTLPHPTFTSLVPLASGDSLKLKCYHSHSSALAIDGSASDDAPFLSVLERPSW